MQILQKFFFSRNGNHFNDSIINQNLWCTLLIYDHVSLISLSVDVVFKVDGNVKENEIKVVNKKNSFQFKMLEVAM